MTSVQSPSQFLDDFIEEAKQAKKRIYLRTLTFEIGEILNRLEPVLIQKAKEGIDVHVALDWVTGRYVGDSLCLLPILDKHKKSKNDEVHKRTQELINRWSEEGVKITITNPPGILTSLLVIFRRSHTKLYIVDDAAWVGGVNLFDVALRWIDFMVKFTNKSVIDALSEAYGKVNDKRPKQNYVVQCDGQNKLLVDAGVIGKSIIYDEAIEAIKKSEKSIVFASQYLPDGLLLGELIKASKREISVSIITSNKEDSAFNKFPYKAAYEYGLNKLSKTSIKVNHRSTKVHAKLLLIDDETAIFGSHNFVNIGVILGTEEIAMRTEDPELIGELKEFIERNTTT